MKYLLENILSDAILKNGSDIHLIQDPNSTKILFRIKGKLEDYRILNQQTGDSLIHYIKYIASLDLDYLLSLNTGGFTLIIHDQSYRFRVSYIPTINANHLVIRLLDSIHFTTLEEITKDTYMINYLRKIEQYQSGLVLLSGPTGVGKSTTLHVLLKEIYEKYHYNIITIEDPIEMIVPEFTQIQISNRISYDDALKQILRHDPDVIMIGELRDSYSANLAIRCALTGCLVFTTIHSKDARSTLQRLKNLEIDEIELNEVLKTIISQRLIYHPTSTGAIFDYYDPIENTSYSYQESILYYEKENND